MHTLSHIHICFSLHVQAVMNEVVKRDVRPVIAPNVPEVIADIIRQCWQKVSWCVYVRARECEYVCVNTAL
jgi:hypothetical protein